MKHYNIPVFISHYGCPYECAFCNQKKINGVSTNIKKGDISRIIEEHLDTLPKDAIKQLAFFGGTFTGIPIKEQIEFLNEVKPYIDKGLIEGIRLSTRPDYINEKIVKILKSYDVKVIELGVQSFDEEVLRLSKRTYKKENVYRAAKIIKSFGIQLGIQIMPGLPGSNFDIEKAGIQEILKIKPNMIRIYPTLVISGTQLEKWYNEGSYIPLSIDEAAKISGLYIANMELNNIKVIRVGLQPSDELRTEGVVIAGPFHSAFREITEGEIYLNSLKKIINNQKEVQIETNEKTVSKLKGIKKVNEKKIGSKFQVIINNNIKCGDFVIDDVIYSRGKVLEKIISECE